jgi:hypothetical protein
MFNCLYVELSSSSISYFSKSFWGRRGRDHMVIGFTITYAIGAYRH